MASYCAALDVFPVLAFCGPARPNAIGSFRCLCYDAGLITKSIRPARMNESLAFYLCNLRQPGWRDIKERGGILDGRPNGWPGTETLVQSGYRAVDNKKQMEEEKTGASLPFTYSAPLAHFSLGSPNWFPNGQVFLRSTLEQTTNCINSLWIIHRRQLLTKNSLQPLVIRRCFSPGLSLPFRPHTPTDVTGFLALHNTYQLPPLAASMRLL